MKGTGVGLKLDPSKRSNDARDFEKAMRKRIVGQDAAVEKVTEIYQMFLAGLNAPGRPVGNLLFLGPTGSGKTRVVEAMAESLFGSDRACIKIDCAEFQHSHEIAKLIGSPPGYLGHRETHPLLTQEALNQWFSEKLKLSILLFDDRVRQRSRITIPTLPQRREQRRKLVAPTTQRISEESTGLTLAVAGVATLGGTANSSSAVSGSTIPDTGLLGFTETMSIL
jgi:Cdc6-like AAA superfamily ATPase